MKKQVIKTFLLLSVVYLAGIFSLAAQSPAKQTVPMDPEVRYGKLSNGLTYYIKHNQKPEQRAEFYLVNNVGAILETDAQNGLAHFCEHMCFNGTKNFPKKGILNYFETVGMQFGRNINAGTNLDFTVYLLMQTPVTREGIIDTALLALKDFSHNVSFEAEEIDAERGILHEEWRSGKDANERLRDAVAPVKYKNSKYAIRDVIGTLDVLDKAPYDTLRQFYHDWYRPDLQAIIVVGDIDLDQMEAKIKATYSDIPAHKSPKYRPTFDVPNNKEPLIAIATDKEAQNTSINIYYKHDYIVPSEKDMQYFVDSYKESLYSAMLNQRFTELTQKENPPFVFANVSYGSFAGNKDAYSYRAMANNNVEAGLKAILIENERVKQHGFTQSELDRAKINVLRNLEKRFKEKDQQQNVNIAFQYFNHFLGNEPTPGIEFEFNMAQKVIPSIQLADINQLAKEWITDENLVITITGPQKEEIIIPTEERVLSIINEIKTSKVEPYIDKVSTKPLVASAPKAGKVSTVNTNKELETTELTLSNGVKVIVKPTQFKEDEILLSAFSNGGTSLYSAEDLPSAEFATTIANTSGISEFSQMDLQKRLAGKVVSVNPYINELYEGFNGNCSPKDLETALQLVYLYFTNPRFDATAWGALSSRYTAFLQNKALNPDAIFQDSIEFILNDRNPRAEPLGIEKLQKINFEKAKKIYSERFADASDFTFVLTGNINLETAKPLIETYLGGLPSIKRKENWKDNKVGYPKNDLTQIISREMQVPKNSIFVNVNNTFENNYENRLLLEAIKHVLGIRYIERIREEESGTYSPQIWVSTSKFPSADFSINIFIDCDPERSDKLKDIVYDEIEKMISNGPSEENLGKAKENFLKSRENNLKENRFWLNSLVFNLQNNENILDQAKYESIVKSMTVEKVKEAANKFLAQRKTVELVLTPAK